MSLQRKLFVSMMALTMLFAFAAVGSAHTGDDHVKVLFWGGTEGHQPQNRLRELAGPMLDRGIELVYVHGDLNFLTLDQLERYDALMVYGNWGALAPEYADAIVQYVENGGGVVAVHAASAMWTNSAWIPLIGGQFQRHGTDANFTDKVVEAQANHPVIKGYEPFVTWEETYVHSRHNEENRTVLAVASNPYNDGEPWTWIRTQGEGRVFYTAWGHDQRAWTQPSFHDLIERGIRYAAGQDVQAALASREIVNPFTTFETPAPIPVYPNHQTNRLTEVQSPLLGDDTAASLERIIVPGGFELQLFADDTMVYKPTDIDWDAAGRAWVLESVDYPYHNVPVNQWPGGNDRIVILEDTDGDGVADKRTVWADQLNIPSSFVFWGGGVIVQQQPYTLFLMDTDGDGKADYREVILTGWQGGTSRGDTHAGAANFTYGLDNMIWGSAGYSSGGGDLNQSIFRFDPAKATGQNRSQVVEHVANTNNNTWGFGLSEEGLLFTSTANGNPSGYVAIPARYYRDAGLGVPMTAPAAGNPFMLHLTNAVRQVDQMGRYTAGSSHRIYTARAFPEEYWNNVAFVAEPTGGLVGAFYLTHDQATITTHNAHNLLVSDDEWVSPIVAKVGPDGAVWVLDFYNIIIQHNPTPAGFSASGGNAAYVTPNRENEYGRIYRVVWSDAPEYTPINLENAAVIDLVNALKNDNMFWRLTAQRMIVEEGLYGAIPVLIDLINDESVDSLGLNVGAIHALWTIHGLGELDGNNDVALEAAVNALQHPSAGVRRNAIQVLPNSWATRDAIVASGVMHDEDAQVVLAAFLKLSEMPASNKVGAAIFAAIESNPALIEDRHLQDAVIIAAVKHEAGFSAAAAAAGIQALDEIEITLGPNLIRNGDFAEIGANGLPAGWTTRTYGGSATHSVIENGGRLGGNAIAITSTSGTDASWQHPVTMEVGATYVMGAWVKTDGVTGAKGASLSMDAMQDVNATRGARTKDFHGTNDWTYRESTFVADRTNDTLLFLFGGWGQSRGTAIVDEVSFRKVEMNVEGELAMLVMKVQDAAK